MKYTIQGFQQDVLVKLGLDSNDALILRWFTDFYISGQMKIMQKDGKDYCWINYGKLLQDLPILNIKKQQIAKRFKKYVDIGLMLHKHILIKGSFSYYYLVGEMFGYLLGDGEYLVDKIGGVYPQRERGLSSKIEGVYPQRESKDSSIINTSIKYIKETPFHDQNTFEVVDNLKNEMEQQFLSLGINSKLTNKNLSNLDKLIKENTDKEVMERFTMFIELCKLSEDPGKVYYDSFEDYISEPVDGLGFDLVNEGKINFFGFSQVFEDIPKAYNKRCGITELFDQELKKLNKKR